MQTGHTQTAIEVQQTSTVLDRRRSARYRFSAPIIVCLADGSSVRAITLEISETGLSACLNVPLTVGEKVHLEPVGGDRAGAIVRRRVGSVYGFECLGLNAEQLKQLRALCTRLPLYRCGGLGI
jgi:hypothetical protein